MSTDRTENAAARSEADPDRIEAPVDPKRLRRRLRRRTAEIERREVEKAVSALDARGDFTEEQRETVREFGSALVGELIAPPERELRRAARTEGTGGRDRERERTLAIRRLFDIDET